MNRRLRRTTVIGSSAAFAVVIGVLVPLKVFGELPEHLTWFKLVYGPLALYGLLAWGVFAGTLWLRHFPLLACVCVAVLVGVALLGSAFGL